MTKLESSTRTWYDSGNSEEGEIAISHQLKTLNPPDLPKTLMPWMLITSIFLLAKGWSIRGTKSASSAIKKDVTCPNIKNTLEKEEEGNSCKEDIPPGGETWKPEKSTR